VSDWIRWKDRWPTKEDCDVYGNVETACRGSRAFITLGEASDFQYDLKRAAFWRTPTELPDFFQTD
jgi:hypothetical protein